MKTKYTPLMISYSVLLRMRHALNKCCRENHKTDFRFSNVFFVNRAIYEKIWKNMQSRPGHR